MTLDKRTTTAKDTKEKMQIQILKQQRDQRETQHKSLAKIVDGRT